jgi:hypothetical protein
LLMPLSAATCPMERPCSPCTVANLAAVYRILARDWSPSERVFLTLTAPPMLDYLARSCDL